MADARRKEHLAQAARLLAVSSPAVAAYLRSSCGDSSDESSQDRVCNGCGNLLVQGWSCQDVKLSERTKRTKRQTRRSRKNGGREVQCDRCASITLLEGKKDSKVVKSKTPPVVKEKSQTMHLPIPEKKPNENPIEATTSMESPSPDATSRKKRGRSKQSSLQSLLANKKASSLSETRSGFSFNDFIKQ